MKSTKVVLLTTNGISGNMICSFLEDKYDLVGVALDSPLPGSGMRIVKRRIKRLGLIKVFLQLLFQKGLVPLLSLEGKNRTRELLNGLDLTTIDRRPDCFLPKSINEPSVIKYVNQLKPEVVMVCGTGIIKKKIIDGIKAPMINIHAGITPKYRGVHGGYWALANKDFENCGVTVHLIDPGIDTGGIISQRTVRPSKKDNYCTYPHLQMREGLKCIEDAIEEIENDQIKIKHNNLSSKLYYHPTITTYLYRRFFNGVK